MMRDNAHRCHRRNAPLGASTLLWLLIAGGCQHPTSLPQSSPRQGNDAIANVLEPILHHHELPAMGAAVITATGDIKTAVVGIKKRGKAIPVTLQDRWHIGSCGKAVHAIFTAQLVEQGRLRWDTTVAEVFPDLAASFKTQLGRVTLEQLLSHTAGLPRDLNYHALTKTGPPRQQRLEAIRKAGQKDLIHAPGTKHEYSNLGCVIAGAMLEKTLDRPYEQAMRDMLLRPMGMESARFEYYKEPVPPDHLWAHDWTGDPIKKRHFGNSDPPALRPAGCVRCTLDDWARFVLHHLRGEAGHSPFLKAASFEKLHTPFPNTEYALGWVVLQRDWGGTVLHHGGSNGFNFSNLWIAPERGFAVLICTNQGHSFKALDEAASALIELHDRWRPL